MRSFADESLKKMKPELNKVSNLVSKETPKMNKELSVYDKIVQSESKADALTHLLEQKINIMFNLYAQVLKMRNRWEGLENKITDMKKEIKLITDEGDKNSAYNCEGILGYSYNYFNFLFKCKEFYLKKYNLYKIKTF